MLINIKMYYKEMGLKVCCFAGFCHHLVSNRCLHTHAYRYPLFEGKQKHVCEQPVYVEKYRTTMEKSTLL